MTIHEYIREHALACCGALVCVPARPVHSPDELRRTLRNEAWEAWVEDFISGAVDFDSRLAREWYLVRQAYDHSWEIENLRELALNRMVQGVFRYGSAYLSDAWPRGRLFQEGLRRLDQGTADGDFGLFADAYNFARLSWERYHRGLP